MTVKNVKITTLKPSPYNPRHISKHDFQALKRSLEEFGLVEPVVVNKNMQIIGGHMRAEAAKSLGMEDVPIVQLDISKKKEKALNLALNRIHGEWDEQKLAEILYELKDNVDEIELTGFTEKEINLSLDSVMDTGEDDFDVEAEKPEVAESKLGEVYELGEHRLMCGDATKKEDVEKLMNGEKADMVFTDPPYGIGLKRRAYDKGFMSDESSKKAKNQNLREWEDDLSEEELEDFSRNIIEAIRDNLVDGGRYYLWSGRREQLSLFRDCINEDEKMHYADIIIWQKNAPVLTRMEYLQSYEVCNYGWKQPSKKDQFMRGGSDVDIWQCKKIANSKMIHLTQKPVELPERAIKNHSQKNDIILDLFGGSGSTLIAAEQLGRKCYMMELDPIYCDVIKKRYAKCKGTTSD